MLMLNDILRFGATEQGNLVIAVVAALLLAIVDSARQLRRARAYDAWWYFNTAA